MTAVWKLDLPASDKLVLLALADAANDDGMTWMALQSKDGIKQDLLKKTSLSRRAVQGAIKRLCEAGYLSRVDRPGKGVIWTVEGCSTCAPQIMRPAADAPGGAADAPKPLSNRQSNTQRRLSRICPLDWSPSVEDRAVAKAEGMDDAEAERALERFRDHAHGKDIPDWSAAYRNWIRKAGDIRRREVKPGRTPNGPKPPTPRSPESLARLEAIRAKKGTDDDLRTTG